MDAPYVSHKYAPVPAAFPSVRNKKGGGVIRHQSSGLIGLAPSGDEGSKWDRADVRPGPQSVPPPTVAPDTGGLPAEWLGRKQTKAVEHD
jgi:hypothetical protein